MHYRITVGGGLGDIVNQIFYNRTYASLDNLQPEDTCEIILITHNPAATELFKWHPKANQLIIKNPGYWTPDKNYEMMAKHNLTIGPDTIKMSFTDPTFYISSEEQGLLNTFKDKQVIVLSAGAGEPVRNIPDILIKQITEYLNNNKYLLVPVGKTFERFDRFEPVYPKQDNIYSLIDKLSVPGTLNLVKQSRAVIACHSSVCLMAWNMKKHNITLLPKSMANKHGIGRGDINEWTFGRLYPQTQLVFNEDFNTRMLEKLLME
jgi:ADP-heptose:LPS heptosyltransferase